MFSGIDIPDSVVLVIELAIIGLLLLGISKFRNPPGARFGNHAALISILAAMALVLVTDGSRQPVLLAVVVAVGLVLGFVSAFKIPMTQMPSMIAIQNGMGGLASLMISFAELGFSRTPVSGLSGVGGFIGVVLGAFTLSGSIVAAAKLNNHLKNQGRSPAINPILVVIALAVAVACVFAWNVSGSLVMIILVGLVVLSLAMGYLFAIRIGGADMPVVISFLNSASGLAAAFTGLALNSRLLVVCGATVGSSGFILTAAMCKAMNRSLLNIFVGTTVASKGCGEVKSAEQAVSDEPAVEDSAVEQGAADACAAVAAIEPEVELTFEQKITKVACAARDAETVVFIPGYGMALAQAQFAVIALANALEKMGKNVLFAIHPVAGRMPGHMNVLLAEADVDYEKLIEMDEINPKFATTDLVFVVGACDVVNSAAIHKEGTPISGMPVLLAHEAKSVVVCNLDTRPGYSGVENPLYEDPRTVMLLGDAKATVEMITAAVSGTGAA
ncbi:MAG TPA: NAD(P)(+) transhydrogenase (Re/Si-specific) subunit beta [Myxococcota bacterium]|nr:NAD(P)(+) transhydrogenase (Re/Si-specific) subunit beta [Myxococcota bacterium]HOA13703.1 NAD(P)(+) transhydrogenase (Re/Si-specific) subunit beta [Myxococcota bacterium]HOH77730.1 NAD(P)(+) transhydrogenase (Re/Si-specific) subunit beta [Myxococcota bacterium]HPV04161.1 NAD(P)(+) transhydrogenase (Re/Si-specific) subunit beta [Myxococcota bacterium]